MKYNGYTVEKLQPGLYAIDDEKFDSMYLIEGKEKALLIDTCVMQDDILPMLRTLTDKPIELALTHAHIDHMYHCGEFDTVYLHEKDIAAWKKGSLRLLMHAGYAMFHVPRKKFNVARFVPITEETVIDLGGVQIRVILASGHTPGSCIFADGVHKALFMGDAVGNGGVSAWMWLPGSLNTSAYRDSLEQLLVKLKPYETYQFLGGHRPQTFPTAENPNGNPLNIEVVKDMYTLCTKMLEHTVEPVGKEKQAVMTIWQYAYGITGMWVRKCKIR